MTDQATLTVQFSPFKLTVLRDNNGLWHAILRRTTDEPTAAPLVSATSISEPHPHVDAGQPKLSVDATAFTIPPKQLRRIGDWLKGLRSDVVGSDQVGAQ